MTVKYYRELTVWQKSIDLAVMVYETVKSLPKEELYSLSDQIRRAAISIPSNIAEGNQRNTTKDYIRFLSIARGSLGELETQLILCERLKYLQKDQTETLLSQCTEVSKMLNGLIQRLQNIETGPNP